jgi:DNA polymerase V
MLNDFTGSGVSQLQLFDERPPRPHSAELMRVLDGINNSGQKYGLPVEELRHPGK